MILRHLTLVASMAILLLAPAGALAEVHEVQMTTEGFEPQFVPAEVRIRPGDTIRWTNTDAFHDHSTASGTGSLDPAAGELWDSGILRLGQSFEFTFEDAGTFEYFSRPHEVEGMFGVVTVSDGTDFPEGVTTSTWGKIKTGFSTILPKD